MMGNHNDGRYFYLNYIKLCKMLYLINKLKLYNYVDVEILK